MFPILIEEEDRTVPEQVWTPSGRVKFLISVEKGNSAFI
jgi:hypothetical protein